MARILVLAAVGGAAAQQMDMGDLMGAMGGMGKGGKGGKGGPPEPLHQTVLTVFDKDHDRRVRMQEVLDTLEGFGALTGMGQQDPGQPNKMKDSVDAAKAVAPTLFGLLDANSDGALSMKELKWLTDLEAAAKSGLVKTVTRDVFAAIDADSDDSLSANELAAATEPEALGKLLATVQEALPTPALAVDREHEVLVRSFRSGVALLDGDGDGVITRKEAGKAVGAFKRKFLDATGILSSMGPMLAMFGGMGAGPTGGRGGRAGSKPGRAGADNLRPRRDEL
jgi:Ca2+-binding EF-hand superfamily protein